MVNSVQSIALDKLVAHPDNPNKMSSANFARLVRNIERTGRYEPLIVRPHPIKHNCFEIINGHHRRKALARLSKSCADAIVWDVDDEQTDILLATLNRLSGSDEVGKKLILLKRLNTKIKASELAKLVPQKKEQIERLISMLDTRFSIPEAGRSQPENRKSKIFLNPLVFFVNDEQKQTIEDALLQAERPEIKKTKAVKRAAALVHMARHFLADSKSQ